jgi:hypothetical protein
MMGRDRRPVIGRDPKRILAAGRLLRGLELLVARRRGRKANWPFCAPGRG